MNPSRSPRAQAAAPTPGMKTTAVRIANQRTILSMLSREPGLSNADLARRSGLAPQTVSAVLDDLDAVGLIVRGEVRRGKRGQPATPVYLHAEGAFVIGAEIGWKRLEVVLINMLGAEIARYNASHDYPDASSVFDIVAGKAKEFSALLTAAQRQRLKGIGIAMPGGLGERSPLIAPPPEQARLWPTIDAAERLAEMTELDAAVYNDGNAASWAELVAHPVPRPRSFAFLLLDDFVGAGIFTDNRLWEGVSGASANLGSMLVTDRQGKPCFVHEIASLYGLANRLQGIGLGIEAVSAPNPTPQLTAVLNEWIEDTAFAVAQTFLNTATVLEYEVAIVDTALPRPVLETIVAACGKHMATLPSLGRKPPRIEAGHLGRSGGAVGAGELNLYQRYFSTQPEHMARYGGSAIKGG